MNIDFSDMQLKLIMFESIRHIKVIQNVMEIGVQQYYLLTLLYYCILCVNITIDNALLPLIVNNYVLHWK